MQKPSKPFKISFLAVCKEEIGYFKNTLPVALAFGPCSFIIIENERRWRSSSNIVCYSLIGWWWCSSYENNLLTVFKYPMHYIQIVEHIYDKKYQKINWLS